MHITIISGTNRPGNTTIKIADEYARLLKEQSVPYSLFDLQKIVIEKNADFSVMEQEYLLPATHFIFVLPEYNGSFPGILKYFIDTTDIAACWHHKNALLTGVSSGRAGNLRRLEHLTGVLLHLKMNVHHNRLPISQVHTLVNDAGEITNEGTKAAIDVQLQEFLKF